jgi:hypothetical protein
MERQGVLLEEVLLRQGEEDKSQGTQKPPKPKDVAHQDFLWSKRKCMKSSKGKCS